MSYWTFLVLANGVTEDCQVFSSDKLTLAVLICTFPKINKHNGTWWTCSIMFGLFWFRWKVFQTFSFVCNFIYSSEIFLIKVFSLTVTCLRMKTLKTGLTCVKKMEAVTIERASVLILRKRKWNGRCTCSVTCNFTFTQVIAFHDIAYWFVRKQYKLNLRLFNKFTHATE